MKQCFSTDAFRPTKFSELKRKICLIVIAVNFIDYSSLRFEMFLISPIPVFHAQSQNSLGCLCFVISARLSRIV